MRQPAIIGLILAYLAFTVLANIGFKLSAGSPHWRGFLWWQVVGNLAGFLSVLSLTFLLKFVPLHLAYALTMGLGFVAVQVVAARLVFHEAIAAIQWLGVLLVFGGIVLISLGKRGP